jgi:hypothetical protein
VRNFIADVLRAGKSVKEAKKMADDVFGEKSLKLRAIYDILKLVLKKAKTPMTRGGSIRRKPPGRTIWSPPLPPLLKRIAEFV